MPVLAQDLRDAVLQAAMEGKLTEQLESDSKINDLINKLCLNKKLDNYFEEPNAIPSHWIWMKIGNLGQTNDTDSFSDGPFGSNLKKIHQTLNPEVRIIQLSNVGEYGWQNDNVKYTTFEHLKTIQRCEVHPGDFVIAKMMPAGRTIIMPKLDTKITLGSDVIKFVPNKYLNKNFLLYAMHSYCFLNQIYKNVKGITRVRTSLSKVKNCVLPIPPFEEQQRIVDKLNEIMPLIDEYEELENQLVELKKKFPEDMKAAILQAAMEGKLTEQYEFFEEKYGDMFQISGGSQPSKSEFIDSPKDGYIQLYQTRDYGDNPKPVYIPLDTAKKQTKEGDILIARYGGSLGKVFIAKNGAYNVALAKVIPINNKLHITKFIYYYHLSTKYQKFCKSVSGSRSAQGGFNKDDISDLVYPLFSIAEQQRIVEKLDQLLPLCDALANLEQEVA